MSEASDVVFVYYAEDSAAIIAITDDYDAIYAVDYPYFTMPREHMNLIGTAPAAPTHGIIYFDAKTGIIKGISLRPDEDLAHYDHIEIDPDLAEKLMVGTLEVRDFFVSPARKLTRTDSDYTLEVLDGNYVVLDETPLSSPLMLRIKIATKDKTIAFKFDTLYAGMHLAAAFETLDVLVTYRDDPSVILETVTISMADLMAQRLIVRALATDFKMHPAVFMKRFLPATLLEVGDENTDRMPMSATADDVIRFSPGGKGSDAALVARIDRKKARVKLTYNRDAGPLYDRHLHSFPIIVTRPKDPSAILTGTTLPLESLLATGKAEFSLPKDLMKHEFDLYAPLFFKSMTVFDNKMK